MHLSFCNEFFLEWRVCFKVTTTTKDLGVPIMFVLFCFSLPTKVTGWWLVNRLARAVCYLFSCRLIGEWSLYGLLWDFPSYTFCAWTVLDVVTWVWFYIRGNAKSVLIYDSDRAELTS